MLTPEEILASMRVPLSAIQSSPVYAIVPKTGPVSFHSQQRRAFNLVTALHTKGAIGPNKTIGVIGAGLAGITASAAAHILGANVTVFEQNEDIFHQQKGNHTRYIHPNVIDWPRSNSISYDTDLPYLNWTAADCTAVIEQIEHQWRSLKINLKLRSRVRVVDATANSAYISCPAPFYYNEFDVVLVAVGFGAENTFGLNQPSYWSDDSLHQLLTTSRKILFVTGTGDGGLIDAMRLAILNFDHGDVLLRVMTHPPLLDIAERLIETDHEANVMLSGKPSIDAQNAASRYLYQRYIS
jgi:hypothetical protein